MPEILIRVIVPNKEHQGACWCPECRGSPGTVLVEWRTRPNMTGSVEFRGQVHAPPAMSLIAKSVEDALVTSAAAVGICGSPSAGPSGTPPVGIARVAPKPSLDDWSRHRQRIPRADAAPSWAKEMSHTCPGNGCLVPGCEYSR